MDRVCIGVIGAGNIGATVITDLILHGVNAVAVDVSDEALGRAEAAVLKHVRFAPMLSKALPRLTANEAKSRVQWSTDLEAAAVCDFVIENVTEEWEIKQPVYEALDRLLPARVCIAANTSCIPIARIAAVTRRPDRVAGMHLMNPVHLKTTVEVIRGASTSDETLQTVAGICRRLQKEAIVVEDGPGFVSNRISHLFMNEAAFVLQDKLASAETIDSIFRKCFGHAMGPLETADLIGLDTVARSLDVLFESFQNPKYRCCPLLRQLVDAGHLGRKTGRGFYEYAESIPESTP